MFCVELLGEGAARIFVRAVESSSFKATELRRAILFVRLGARFSDLPACVDAIRPDLSILADTARRRSRPDKDNLFATVEYGRDAWSACSATWIVGRGAEGGSPSLDSERTAV